jgi:hypothetical protein
MEPVRAVVRTGPVIVGYYATKLRRAIFAQTRELVKSGQLTSQEVARGAGELNRWLYSVLVDKLVLSKADIVRIEAPYAIIGGKIVWEWDKIKISVYRRVDPEVVSAAMKHAQQERILVEPGQ